MFFAHCQSFAPETTQGEPQYTCIFQLQNLVFVVSTIFEGFLEESRTCTFEDQNQDPHPDVFHSISRAFSTSMWTYRNFCFVLVLRFLMGNTTVSQNTRKPTKAKVKLPWSCPGRNNVSRCRYLEPASEHDSKLNTLCESKKKGCSFPCECECIVQPL